jgi:endo-1,4-beta-xylanase
VRPALSFLAFALLAAPAALALPAACRDPAAGCTLAETAAQACFWIGAALDAGPEPAAEAVYPDHFNSVTAENAHKWGSLSEGVGSYDFTDGDRLVDFAEANGARVRGHTLFWGRGPVPPDLGAEIAGAADPAARAREILVDHVSTVVGHYAGRIQSWDVVNEPLDVLTGAPDPNILFQQLGFDYIADAFHAARAADPGAQLFLNEFFQSYTGAKADAFVALVADLLASGVPVDGVGVQTHITPGPGQTTPPDPAEFQGFLQRLADLGVAVEITELDVAIFFFLGEADPLAAQAEAYAELVGACIAVSACQGVTVWGIEDGSTWLDRTFPWDLIAPNLPLLFDADLDPKPAYFATRDAIAARVVPEPGSALLLAGALVSLGIRRWTYTERR